MREEESGIPYNDVHQTSRLPLIYTCSNYYSYYSIHHSPHDEARAEYLTMEVWHFFAVATGGAPFLQHAFLHSTDDNTFRVL